VEPRLRTHTQVDHVGNRLGVTTLDGADSYGVTIRISPAAQPDPATLISVLGKLFDRADTPISAAQLVVCAIPSPARSPIPVRVHRLAVRYRYDEAPWAAVARGDGEAGRRKAAASVALRLMSDLAEVGYPSSACDAPDLHDELHAALGADPDPLHGKGSVSYRATEDWRSWSVGRLRQICFVPRRPGDAIALMGRCDPSAAFTCTACTLRRDARGRVQGTAAVRIGVPNDRFRDALHRRPTGLGVRLNPTNGRHSRYVMATLPLALA
jgi:hypothetical protein